MENTFQGILVTEKEGSFSKEVQSLELDALPKNDTLIRVHYSSINYKDALSGAGNRGVTRKFPHVPGIDAAGTVVRSASGAWQEGEEVIVTGFDLGMNTWGGLGQYISVPADWCIRLPEGLSLREAMSYGTAGLTAGLCVHKLLQAGLTPDKGPIAVSGATGGVGSISLGILKKLGFDTVAISGKIDLADYFTETLGVSEIINRTEFIDESTKPLLSARFAGAIDTVGGTVLTTLLRSLHYNGAVAACGMAQSGDLTMTVFPFILKGISLLGVDSVQCAMDTRREVWQKLAFDWRPAHLNDLVTEIGLSDVAGVMDAMLAGKTQGRTVVRLD
ncbi:YhdH/YhfP family quinone oxidoreductase [Spirosoma sp. KUDC1026]|uniref:YhdH/YhfP family quinone oxidoreductase n=1 Tax=Spirosoma sp. KUDC1026 TaxID=2745947 RepID=UPI00159BAFBF|nr:YhdH/YhfP family quinone oxidoreductase [Spirosoma sp. KUDC1026]QKZ12950.1 YhdH/YhfP family quinone oxidoreductase [Spirosoma sp. KUDC1026]